MPLVAVRVAPLSLSTLYYTKNVNKGKAYLLHSFLGVVFLQKNKNGASDYEKQQVQKNYL